MTCAEAREAAAERLGPGWHVCAFEARGEAPSDAACCVRATSAAGTKWLWGGTWEEALASEGFFAKGGPR
jgi:hypothetical protein